MGYEAWRTSGRPLHMDSPRCHARLERLIELVKRASA
jgi:hypothetical protein